MFKKVYEDEYGIFAASPSAPWWRLRIQQTSGKTMELLEKSLAGCGRGPRSIPFRGLRLNC